MHFIVFVLVCLGVERSARELQRTRSAERGITVAECDLLFSNAMQKLLVSEEMASILSRPDGRGELCKMMETQTLKEQGKSGVDNMRAPRISANSSDIIYNVGEFDSKSVFQSVQLALRPAIRNPKNDAATPSRMCSQELELAKQIKRATSLQDVLALTETYKAIFMDMHLTLVWQRVAKLSKRGLDFGWDFSENTTIPSLVTLTVRMLPRARARAIATLAHRAARAKCSAPVLLATLARTAQDRLGTFNSQELANTVWAFATLKHDAPQFFEAVAEIALERLADFTPQGLTNTVWAFATVKYDAPKLFEAVALIALDRLEDFKPQELVNTVWAFAKLKYDAPKLFNAVGTIGVDRLKDFKPRDFANTVWAFAKLKHDAPQLFEAVAEIALERLADFTPQELAITVWAFATLKHDAPKLFDAVAEIALESLADFTPQGLGITVWAFATLKHDASQLFDAVAERAASERLKISTGKGSPTQFGLSSRSAKIFDGACEMAKENLSFSVRRGSRTQPELSPNSTRMRPN